MVVKMFKKILTRKKAPVSNRKYTKKNTKKKSKKIGGGRGRGQPGNGRGRAEGPRAAPDPETAEDAAPAAPAAPNPAAAAAAPPPAAAPPAAAAAPPASARDQARQDKIAAEGKRKRAESEARAKANKENRERADAAVADAIAADEHLKTADAAVADAIAADEKYRISPKGRAEAVGKSLGNAYNSAKSSAKSLSKSLDSAAKGFNEGFNANSLKDEDISLDELEKMLDEAKKNNASVDVKKQIAAAITNYRKQNNILTNQDGRTPERANMESNLKFNEQLPMLMKTFKKAKVNPGDKSEYFNLDNDSLKKLVNYWYGNKRGFFDKVLRGLGVTGPPVPIAEWDVSQVTNMSYLFTEAKDFNENISSWNVSNVQSMAYMFYESDRFSQNINDWDVGNVRNMRGMFQRSQKFNSYLDQWDTGRVLDMRDMFKDSRKFNRNIDTWNVSNVRNMERMFENTAYNKPLASWNVMSVVNMAGMFRNNVKFNQPLANWGSSLKSIKNLDLFLQNAKSFNQDLSDWNLSKIGVPESMLVGTTVRQEFYPIGQRVNTQSQNMGLTPSEEKRARDKQVNEQVKADLNRLKESQEQAKISYERQKMIHDEKLDEFKDDLKKTEAAYLKEQKRKENEMQRAIDQEELELKRNRELLKDISGKPDDYKRSRSVKEARKDALSTSRASSDYQPGSETSGAADPKPIRVPNINREKMENFTNLPKGTDWKKLTEAAIKKKNAKDVEDLFQQRPDLFQKPKGNKGNRFRRLRG
jgi:surface protein